MDDGIAVVKAPGGGPTEGAPAPRTLRELIAAVRHGAHHESTSVADIMAEIGDRSFAPAVLLPALILVSPISGIPGTPTLGAVIIVLIALQWLFGRDHLWLPRFVMRRAIPSHRLHQGLDFLDRPAGWVDRHTHRRLLPLVRPPLGGLAILAIVLIAGTWPLLELLPMVTTVGAIAVSLFAIGLMTRDGLFVVAGYAFVGFVVYGVGVMAAAAGG